MSKPGKIANLTCSCPRSPGPSFILVAREELWVKTPWAAGSFWGLMWGLEMELRQGNGLFCLSLCCTRLSCKVDWTWWLSWAEWLCRKLIKHSADDIVWLELFLPGQILKQKKIKLDNPTWDSLYNCKCHCCTRNCMYWLRSLNRREGKWADDSSKIIFSIEYSLRPSKEEKKKVNWCAGEEGICYNLFA